MKKPPSGGFFMVFYASIAYVISAKCYYFNSYTTTGSGSSRMPKRS